MIPREVVESGTYKAQARLVESNPQSLDEKLAGVLFAIARTPESFPRVGNTRLYAARYIGDPSMLLWFTFNDRQVTLLGIH